MKIGIGQAIRTATGAKATEVDDIIRSMHPDELVKFAKECAELIGCELDICQDCLKQISE